MLHLVGGHRGDRLLRANGAELSGDAAQVGQATLQDVEEDALHGVAD